MRILGIDPGYERLGIAVIEKNTVLYSDCFRTSAKDDIHKRLGEIGVEISKIIEKFQPDALAIETLFISTNQKTGMRVAEARGIIMYEAIKRGVLIYEYSPMQIKTAVTSDGSSDKSRMIKMVNLLVSLPKKKMLDDEYDAIAVALTHAAIIHSR
ncbi:MAG: crossover junction endodeoxyribonuclease RuvC [Candidatus Taylorbacteria bacterium]